MLARFRIPIGWGEILRRTFKESFFKDDLLSMSAQLAYYFFLSLFPALIFLISIASFFPIANLMDEVVRTIGRVAPPEVLAFLLDQMRKISDRNQGGVLTVAFLVTLWSTSTAMLSVLTTLNQAYDIEESRPWWKTRLTAILLTMGLALFILTSAALVIAGPELAERLADRYGLGAAFEWTWKILQWPLILLLVISAMALVYYFAPDAEQEFVLITPGAVLATLLWILASLGVRVYLANFGNYTETYGALAGVMIMLLWFYVSGLCILIGAELNAEIEHASPYGKAPGEKTFGERRRIGVLAEREYEARLARGETPETATLAASPNCTLAETRHPAPREASPSELILGAVALLPAVFAVGRRLQAALQRQNPTPSGEDGVQAPSRAS